MTCLIHLPYRLSLECLVVAFKCIFFTIEIGLRFICELQDISGHNGRFFLFFFLNRFILQTTADSSEAVCHKQVPVKKHSKYKRCQVIVGHLYSLSATSAPVEAALMSVTSAQRQVCEKKTSIGTHGYTRGNLSAVVRHGVQQVRCFIMDVWGYIEAHHNRVWAVCESNTRFILKKLSMRIIHGRWEYDRTTSGSSGSEETWLVDFEECLSNHLPNFYSLSIPSREGRPFPHNIF